MKLDYMCSAVVHVVVRVVVAVASWCCCGVAVVNVVPWSWWLWCRGRGGCGAVFPCCCDAMSAVPWCHGFVICIVVVP